MLLINCLLEWLAIVTVPGAEPTTSEALVHGTEKAQDSLISRTEREEMLVALFQVLNHSIVAVLGSESSRPRVSYSGVLFGAHA